MESTTPRLAVFTAPASWRVVDFISDLHLQASEPATAQAWERYMAHTHADAVFILGDLFEVWVGDDAAVTHAAHADLAAQNFEAYAGRILHAASQRRAVFFMHGNRDFLLGASFARTCGMGLLNDPTVLDFGSQRWLLSHGDALCLGDTDYLQFRAQVRSPEWQQTFLARPLNERRALAQGLRAQSEARKRSGASYADVDTTAARRWLQAAGAQALIHGHTHRPADHELGPGLRRHVLSDWDATSTPPRTEVLRLTLHADSSSVRMQRLPCGDAG